MRNSPSKVYQFDPLIYPRLIWVVYGNNLKEVNNDFCYTNGNNLDFDSENSDGCAAKVINKKTKKLGILIWVSEGSEIKERADILVHEATHAAFDILEDIGFILDYKNQEPIAYLTQFIFKCAKSVVKLK